MRLVGAPVVVKIPLAIPAGPGVMVVAILATKALHRGPCLDQRAVNREMFRRQQAPHLGQVQNGVKELSSDVAGEQPIAVVAEHRGHPYRLVHGQPNEPAKEQIVVQLLSDVSTQSAGMRKLVFAHSMVAYLFNTAVIALGVNIAASLAS